VFDGDVWFETGHRERLLRTAETFAAQVWRADRSFLLVNGSSSVARPPPAAASASAGRLSSVPRPTNRASRIPLATLRVCASRQVATNTFLSSV
jgi:hypothetical protein